DANLSRNIPLAPFNEILGIASTNVPAYSNGNDSYTSQEYYYLYGVYMGMKWQYVEYARRCFFMRKGCVFQSVEGVADVWSQGSPYPPKNESLLIYSRSDPDMPLLDR
ncbi:unnamed protein product, partial [Rotaria sordida]